MKFEICINNIFKKIINQTEISHTVTEYCVLFTSWHTMGKNIFCNGKSFGLIFCKWAVFEVGTYWYYQRILAKGGAFCPRDFPNLKK